MRVVQMKPVHGSANEYCWLPNDCVTVYIAHQQLITGCEAEWACLSKRERCDMVKCQHFRCRIHPNSTNEL